MADIFSTNANLLVAFAVLAEERSVTRAARRFGISQSAMSGVLAQLRDLFDDPLLVRAGNLMALTPRADALAKRVCASVAELDLALTQPGSFDPAKSIARFVLAMSDYTALVLLPPLMERLTHLAPKASVQVLPWGKLEATPALAEGGVDVMVGILEHAKLPPGFHRQPVFEDRFVCIVRKDHPTVGRELTLETYLKLSHVIVTEKPWASGVVDKALERLGHSRTIGLRVPHYSIVPQVVATSDLIAAIDERFARRFVSALPLRIVEPPLKLRSVPVDLLWHSRTADDPARKWLRQCITDVAATLPPVGVAPARRAKAARKPRAALTRL